MSILSTIICTLSGRLLFCRQNPPPYIPPMTKRDIYNHMVSFIRNYNPKSQTTLIENESYRYVYLPLNSHSIYLVIITSNTSNIISDMNVLKLSHRAIIDICKNVTENSIIEKGIDIVMSLDEIVFNGLQYSKNIYDVKTKVNMIKFDIKEIKEIQREQREKEREIMKKQMEEMEKVEKEKEMNQENRQKNNNKRKEIHIDNNIRLKEKIEFIQLEKPNVFKTPSGKVVLLSSRIKRKEEQTMIKGLKLVNIK